MINVVKHLWGKTVTNIRAYGIDKFDFTPAVWGYDFSVGEFGYALFEFDNDCFYVSIDGISTVAPPRKSIYELDVPDRVRKAFAGEVLTSITFDGKKYKFQFEGLLPLYGWYDNDNRCDRAYFELEFPWI